MKTRERQQDIKDDQNKRKRDKIEMIYKRRNRHLIKIRRKRKYEMKRERH